MKTYKKNYAELNSEELISFLTWTDEDYNAKEVIDKMDKYENLNAQVAFALNDNNEITAVDYRFFDPMRICYDGYIYADGWSNWFFDNYDEDEEVDEETILAGV